MQDERNQKTVIISIIIIIIIILYLLSGSANSWNCNIIFIL
jgi:hypothetical protein